MIVKPLSLENGLRLILLLAPYLVKLEHRWPQLLAALEATNGTRPKLLETIFIELRQDLVFMPGDVVLAFGLLIDRDVTWIAENTTALDLIKSWPILDEVNNFADLWQAARALGITANYARPTN